MSIDPWARSVILGVLLLSAGVARADAPCTASARFKLVVHGGAGAAKGSPKIKQHKRGLLLAALRAGEEVLRAGGTAVDAVERSIQILEDAPAFNAGRGGVPNKAGFVELDASIMRGRDRNAGAVAAVRTVRHPISAARAVMEKSSHVLFVDRGADAFARSVGLEPVDPSWLLVPRKKASKSKSGTVGAVALDRCGNLAAGTSTGGYNTKTPGRVGDSPIIGAGTYADNQAGCAVSATGHGEFFIRYAAAYDVCARVKYQQWSIERAASHVIHKTLEPAGGKGGFIAIDREGRTAWPFSTGGMIRGVVDHSGRAQIGIGKKMTGFAAEGRGHRR